MKLLLHTCFGAGAPKVGENGPSCSVLKASLQNVLSTGHLLQRSCRNGPHALEEVHQTLPLVSLKGWRPFSDQSSALSSADDPSLGLPSPSGEGLVENDEDEDCVTSMTPKEVVEHLDRNIVGQASYNFSVLICHLISLRWLE